MITVNGRGGEVMLAELLVAGLITLGLLIYLVYALLYPARF
jgi:K+-transporting ATPase KdpF subunit